MPHNKKLQSEIIYLGQKLMHLAFLLRREASTLPLQITIVISTKGTKLGTLINKKNIIFKQKFISTMII